MVWTIRVSKKVHKQLSIMKLNDKKFKKIDDVLIYLLKKNRSLNYLIEKKIREKK